MEKKPMTMKQKYKIFNIGRIISYALLIFGFLMDGFANPMTWVGIVLVIAVVVMLGTLGVIVWMAKRKKPAEDQNNQA